MARLPAPHKIPLGEWIQRVSDILKVPKVSYDAELRKELLLLHNDKFLSEVMISDGEFTSLYEKINLYYSHIINAMKKSGLDV